MKQKPSIEITQLDVEDAKQMNEKIEFHMTNDSQLLGRMLSNTLNESFFSDLSAAEKHDKKVEVVR